MSLNKVMLIGNVGAEPEIRYLAGANPQDNIKVASLRLATSERYRDRTTNEVKETTEWHSISAWRGLADIIEKFVHKGTQIYVEGRIRTRTWTDRDNNTRYSTEIVADSLQLLGRRPDAPATWAPTAGASTPTAGTQAPASQTPAPSAASPQSPSSAPVPPSAPLPEPDDDLPF